MNERFAQVSDDIELCYETFGDPSNPTMLLIMGLGTQMLGWHEGFCAKLVDRGFHVVRFDNRDCGRSTHFKGVRPPTTLQLLKRDRAAAAYLLSDMAGDAVGLLDHLGVERAHIVGASMGGMIAQTLLIEHPQRALSLTSIMSTTGNRWRGQPALTVMPILWQRPPRDRDAYVEHMVGLFGKIGSPEFEGDIERLRQIAGLSYDRAQDPAGTGRQLGAVVASGDRTQKLRGVRVPTLVVHGKSDKLVRPSGGRATAKAIPGAKLLLFDGMGHDLPVQLWPRLIDAIVANAERAAAPARAAA